VDETRLLELQHALGSEDPPEDGSRDPLAALTQTNEGLLFGPVVDGELIRRPTLDSLRAGVGADKVLVAGAAEDEIEVVTPDVASRVAGIPAPLLLARLGLDRTAAQAYLDAHEGATTPALLQAILTDYVFRTAALGAAQALPPGRTWLYRFGWMSPTFGLAIHCIDVPFWFDCLDAERVTALTGPNPPQALAAELHAAAVAFITNGDPGWPAYTPDRGAVMVFDGAPRVVDDGYRDVRPLVGAPA
jgi:para-nitrobenzyl esterase